ncbi:DUF1700 domain-containing protein [Phytoactinopolyspora mesophila]|uniref:DUF1700 domain-containing protein n=1 Tax=Phytoactinopolyspora mesophila TaxID=2650750 RepID=A0A7K3M857_9ACTN|nr:hypothetical protein [Phytoactinopolyspora mesophila]NDL59465.1 hypothetical protein [Phytoactinopolyspora mesophila]
MTERSGEGAMRNNTQLEKVRLYLDELDAALAARGVFERAEIVASVREHIESALGESGAAADADAVLASLGDPLTIAAEADDVGGRGRRDDSAPATLSSSWVPPAVIALVMLSSLALMFYLPIVTLLIGLVVLWVSTLWRPGEKLLGTFMLPLPGVALWAALGAGFTSGEVCVSESTEVEVGSGQIPDVEQVCTGGATVWGSVVGTGFFAAALAAGIAAAVVIYRRGMSRVR